MKSLAAFVYYEAWFLIVAFFVLIGYQILTGKIKTNGLLSAKDSKGGISPARIQLLVLTLTGAFYYLAQVTKNPAAGLPTVPQQLLLALGGSNLFYAARKAYTQLLWPRGGSNRQNS
jgi:hypothetical protein